MVNETNRATGMHENSEFNKAYAATSSVTVVENPRVPAILDEAQLASVDKRHDGKRTLERS